MSDTTSQTAGAVAAGMRAQLHASLDALRAVLRNRDLGSLELSLATSVAADWAYVVAVMLVAYQEGGAAAVGGVGVARMLVATVTAPLVSGMADRAGPRRMLIGSGLVRVAAIGAGAVVLLAGGPPVAVLGAVAVEAGAFAVFRPIGLAIFPALARSPGELVTANLASSIGENLGTLVGPILGGLAMAVAGPVAASALVLAMVGISIAGVITLREEEARPAGAVAGASTTGRRRGAARAALTHLGDGARLLRHRPAPRAIVLVFGAQVVVRGSLTVLLVVAAIDLLGLGQSGVGVLTSAIGLGGFVGALGSVALVGRSRLARVFAIAAVAWGAPIAAIGLLPRAGVAFAALVVVGAANALLDVSGFTLLQRTTPNSERPAVFGLLEGVAGLGVAAGSAVGPLLVAWLGAPVALLATGAILPLAVLAAWRPLARADDAAVIPERQLSILRAQPMFTPLPLTVLERMAECMTPARFDVGDLLTRQGDPGDCFYLIETGTVEVERDGQVVRTLGPSAAIGEIALLRHVPRTATVRVTSPASVFALTGTDFIAAITKRQESVSVAEAIVAERLADA